MRAITTTVGPFAAASANNIAASQTPVSGTALTINGSTASGGIATLDQPRRVILTVGSEAAPRTMVLTGTNWSGNTISETIVVPATTAGAISSVLDYKTITSALPGGGGYSAAVTLGTVGTATYPAEFAASPWIRLDEFSTPQVSMQCDVTGTTTYTVESTLDDPNDPTNPTPVNSVVWLPSSDASVVGATASKQTNFAYTPRYVRLGITAGTGSVTFTVYQAGTKHVSL